MHIACNVASVAQHPKEKKRGLEEVMGPLQRAVALRRLAVFEMAHVLLDGDEEEDATNGDVQKLLEEHQNLVLITYGLDSEAWCSHQMLEARLCMRKRQVQAAMGKFKSAAVVAQQLGLDDKAKICAISLLALSLSTKKQRTDDDDKDGNEEAK
jgi:hypothetical protein